MGRKQWEKEKMLVTSIFSFPTMFLKAFFLFVCLFVLGFTRYQQYFTATVHTSMFSRTIFLNQYLIFYSKNIVEKEEIALNEQFLLFPQRFLPNQKIVSPFVNIYDITSIFAAELEEHKINMCRKGLTSPLSWHWRASRSAVPIILSAMVSQGQR